ncbi:MAG: efflux RND transporter periplasmic adaptor subunit [Ardenticatenaceae bacterium]|nr:efflux RND transporter periplasmic adaptor subunit [Ardenticatenaceae bacterium]
MFRRKTFWIPVILVLVAAGVGGYYYYTNYYTQSQTVEEAPLQTAVVRRGNIVISATGAGTVIANDEVALAFQTSGILSELLVQVGDNVKTGDVLARLDDTEAQENLALVQLQRDLAAIDVDPDTIAANVAAAEVTVSQAEIDLATAQANLDELLNWQADSLEVQVAEANYKVAQGNYYEAANRDALGDESIASTRISLEQAQANLASAQEAYTSAYDPGREWELNYSPQSKAALERERSSAESRLTSAEQSLEVAQANYDLATVGLNYNSTLSAQSSLLNAQMALEDAQAGPTSEELAAAQLAVDQANVALSQAKLNLESAKVNTQAEISYSQAELNLQSAQETVDNTELTAPIEGTVMSISAALGETVGSSTLIELANLDQPTLEIYLDETDLDNIGLDYEVDVYFDALPDDVFTGHVTQIDPQLNVVNGVTTVRAIVQLDTDSFAKPQNLPIGLNATVDVIGGRADNALLVPVEALRELSDGEYAVFVMENGEPVLRFVTVGIMDYTYAEITSGLEQGETVTTGIVETQ